MLAITVDVEDWYHQPWITGAPFSKFKDVEEFFSQWTEHYDYLSEPTIRTLDLLDELNTKATFFIVADVVDYCPGLVQQIVDRGHEIACHGLHHACKIHPRTKEPLMSIEEFEARTLQAKKILEEVSGKEVIGHRAPNACISGWMLDSLDKLGFRYDSSISANSFYNKTDSPHKSVTSTPYYPRRGSVEPGDERRILEIPWPYFEFGLRFPTAGGPLLRLLGAKYITLGLKQSLKRGDTFFYFHPIDISKEKLPWNLPLRESTGRSKGISWRSE
jgi:peptidoglycan/xylan/chitin deacetylase (PgdA/CDA1 family)